MDNVGRNFKQNFLNVHIKREVCIHYGEVQKLMCLRNRKSKILHRRPKRALQTDGESTQRKEN